MAAAQAVVIDSGGYSRGRSKPWGALRRQETGYRCFVTTAGWRRTVGTSEELSYRGRELHLRCCWGKGSSVLGC